MHFDLLKEGGFEDIFFEKKFAHLMGYEEKADKEISEKSLLDFHLSHRTNESFKFEPKICPLFLTRACHGIMSIFVDIVSPQPAGNKNRAMFVSILICVSSVAHLW